MYPSREKALMLLQEAERRNPGPWAGHSRVAASCAERIADRCPGMDADKAYVLGLLHDIGRRAGVRQLGHVAEGVAYMKALGYDEAARVCLSHSFNTQSVKEYVGKADVTKEEMAAIREGLDSMAYDDYDRLIQLCDAIAGTEGVMDMRARMEDVRRRYGRYPKAKWEANLRLQGYFEEKMGMGLQEALQGLQTQDQAAP